MSTVFKFFRPNGDCRRVSFQAVPSIEDVNSLVKELVPWGRVGSGGATSWKLSYTDSEGDAVLITTSEDLVEAASDAKASGAKSVKVVVRRADGGCGARAGRGGARCRGSRLLSAWKPHEMAVDLSALPDEWKAIVKHWHTACGGFSIINDDAVEGESSSVATSQPSAPEKAYTTASAAKTPKEDDTVAATSAASTLPTTSPQPQECRFTFAEREQVSADSESASSSDEIERKAELLKEMGFSLPRDVAHNMIKELNGRMDLIIRALVANSQ